MKILLASRRLWLGVGLLVALVVVLVARGAFDPQRPVESTISGAKELGENAVRTVTGGSGFGVTSDTPGYENYQKLRNGCPVKDCIPSIDDPVFESRAEGDKWLEDDDVVFAINYKGVERAYPQRIMNWHEIVNDVIAGDPIAITFCPLCGSAIAFERSVGGQVLEFGVSGKLFNSDLVMYDRQTETLWEQITGKAIVGEQFETVLKPVSMDTVRWSDWRENHPKTVVLSRDTGAVRDYDRYPYNSYESDGSVYFPVEGGVDETIHPKTEVFGVEVNGVFKAYPRDLVEERTGSGTVTDRVGGTTVRIEYSDGEVKFTNVSSGEELVPARMFWFAWKAFRPETELYE